MTQNNSNVPSASSTVFAIVGLVLSIISYVVPVFGVLFINPLAGICVCIALFLGSKSGMTLIAMVIIILKYVISPTFWVNIAAGGDSPANALLTWVGAILSVAMIGLYARNVSGKNL